MELSNPSWHFLRWDIWALARRTFACGAAGLYFERCVQNMHVCDHKQTCIVAVRSCNIFACSIQVQQGPSKMIFISIWFLCVCEGKVLPMYQQHTHHTHFICYFTSDTYLQQIKVNTIQFLQSNYFSICFIYYASLYYAIYVHCLLNFNRSGFLVRVSSSA